MTFVVSLRLGEPADARAAAAAAGALPDAALQARPDARPGRRADRASWSRRARSTRSTSRATTAARWWTSRPTRSSTAASPRAFPDAWLEDPTLTAGDRPRCSAAPRPHHVGRADPLVADIEALPFPPRMVNVKPSRFGGAARAVRRLRLLRRARHRRLRRRAVRARRRPRADPVPGVALPSRHAQRRCARRLQRSRPRPGLPASPLDPAPSEIGFRCGGVEPALNA